MGEIVLLQFFSRVIVWAALLGGAIPALAGQLEALSGRVADSSGAPIAGATVLFRLSSTGAVFETTTGAQGEFRMPGLAPGDYVVRASADGFGTRETNFRWNGIDLSRFDIELQPATLTQQLVVRASQIVGLPEQLARMPGSVDLLDNAVLTQARILSTEEALRKVAGIHARAEEGFGMRPNIGIRGLNPTRSSRVLLLEDGSPLSYAPYGDNASYYHPPIDRFDSIEVVKGSGQILYGPMTVGGVVNYVTPAPPDKFSGAITLTGGNRDYLNGHLRLGGTWRKTGLLFDAMRKQGDLARENTHTALNDVTAKSLTPIGSRQTLSLKANYYTEESNLTYSGLREDEFAIRPRYNLFRNDFFYAERYGGAATHTAILSPSLVMSTQLYASAFLRDWWRQSSNSSQRPNDAADPLCQGMANLHTTCGNEGRLRQYQTWGVEPRWRASFSGLGARNEADFGLRFHDETQERIQQNGPLPASRSGVTVEDNRRRARAYSGFLQNRFQFGRLTVTPGLRLERVAFNRTNRLANGGAGVFGRTALTQAIPGIGAAFNPSSGVTIFAGVHRGFAPPRVEDVINNSTGTSVDLDSELSWNYEAGLRARVRRAMTLEATWFRMDFSNQIVPASVAGGIGAVLTNAGQTKHEGAEVSARLDWRNAFGGSHSFYLRNAWTWLPVARFSAERFSSVPGFTRISVLGNRLPYAPGNLLNSTLGYSHARGLSAFLEAVYTGSQFGDDLNTRPPSPDGQRGILPGNVLWNATLNYPVEAWHASFYVTAKNLFDRTVIVDRSRGILPGLPRLVQAGVRFSFR